MLGPVLVALIAIAPGAFTWWTGRSLARRTDDPALPELLMARQQRLIIVSATVLALTIVLGGAHAWWALPLLAISLLSGGYPLRRTLLGETAPLWLYLWRSLKSMLGAMGFWILLVFAPVIVLAIDATRWWLALALIPLLLLWELFYQHLWLRLHDAEPLAEPELAPRIATIVERAGIPAPALFRLGAPGTRFVNAFAFPSVRRPAIGLGNALLELLDPDEIAAIYAHELSHLEQFSPRVVRRLQVVTWLLILGAVGVPLLVRWLAPAAAQWTVWLWPLVVVFVLVHRAKKSQDREHESDLRAAALTGDPEAVARGLIKVHVHGFIPRRWAIDFERNASHPSLARRIQALRGQGEQAVASLGAPTVLPTAREGSYVVFENDRAWWFDGVPPGTPADHEALRTAASSARSVAWPYLLELRVTASGEGRALAARHRNGDRWSVPLDGAQVAAVQQALDRVDVRLHRDIGRKRLASAWPLAAGILLAMLLTGRVGILFVPALLVLWRPAAASLAALGAMAAATALFALGQRDAYALIASPGIGLAVLGTLGLAALVVAWRSRRSDLEALRRNGRLTLLVLGATAALLLAGVVLTLASIPGGSLAALPGTASVAATLLGMAGALALMETRRARQWSLAAGLGGLLVGLPVLRMAMPVPERDDLTRVRAGVVEVARVPLGGSASNLQLSPGAARFLVQRIDERAASRPRPLPPTFVLGDTAGTLREIDATQVDFASDEHILVLQPGDSTFVLRLERADTESMLWSMSLPDLYAPTLVVSPGDRTWTVAGEEVGSDSLLVMAGSFDAPEGRVRRFAPLDSIGGLGFFVFGGGDRLLVPTFEMSVGSRLPFLLTLLSRGTPKVDLWEVTAAGHRRVGRMDGYPQCGAPDSGAATCVIRHGLDASVWTLRAQGAERRVSRLGVVHLAHLGPGPRVTALSGTERIIDVDLASQRLTTIELPVAPAPYEARSAAGHLAVLRSEAAGTRFVLYRIDPR